MAYGPRLAINFFIYMQPARRVVWPSVGHFVDVETEFHTTTNPNGESPEPEVVQCLLKKIKTKPTMFDCYRVYERDDLIMNQVCWLKETSRTRQSDSLS